MDVGKPPEKKDIRDFAREIGKALVSSTPVVGGPLQVLFENVVGPSLEKRRDQWFEGLAAVVDDLQKSVSGLTPEKLAANPAFITVTLQATQVAMRNHQEEKLAALRNAVFNSGLPGAPSDDDQLTFLRLIETLTPWHLRLLALLSDPAGWMANNGRNNPGWGMGGVSSVIEHCFPELKADKQFYQQCVRELQAAGLVGNGEFLNITMTGQGMLERRTTGRGEAFLAYITRKG